MYVVPNISKLSTTKIPRKTRLTVIIPIMYSISHNIIPIKHTILKTTPPPPPKKNNPFNFHYHKLIWSSCLREGEEALFFLGGRWQTLISATFMVKEGVSMVNSISDAISK